MATTATVERLGVDLVTIAQCIVLDADAFPYPSARFGSRSASEPAWVARGGGPRVVGFLAARVQEPVLHVQGVAVDPAWRGLGIGRALLRAATDAARGLELLGVALCVSVTNRPAISLYESEGFLVARRLRDYYAPGVYPTDRDGLEMRRLLRV